MSGRRSRELSTGRSEAAGDVFLEGIRSANNAGGRFGVAVFRAVIDGPAWLWSVGPISAQRGARHAAIVGETWPSIRSLSCNCPARLHVPGI